MSSSPSSSQKYRSPRQTGESTLNVVEEDIRKAEELLAKDVYRRGQEQKPPSEKHQQRDRQVRTQSSQRHGGRTRSSPITSGSHQQTQTSQSSASATVTKPHEEWREATEKAVKNALKAALGSPPVAGSSADKASSASTPMHHRPQTHHSSIKTTPHHKHTQKSRHTEDRTPTTSQQYTKRDTDLSFSRDSLHATQTSGKQEEVCDKSFSREERDQIVKELLQAHASHHTTSAESPRIQQTSTPVSTPSTYREPTAAWLAKQQRSSVSPGRRKEYSPQPSAPRYSAVSPRSECLPPGAKDRQSYSASKSYSPGARSKTSRDNNADSANFSNPGRVENFMDSDSEDEGHLPNGQKGQKISFVSQDSDSSSQQDHWPLAFRRKSKEELEAEAEEQFRNHHPFRPQINPKSKQVATNSGSSCYERFDRYYQEKQHKIEQLKRERQQQEQEVCTFRPKTNSSKNSPTYDNMSTDSLEGGRDNHNTHKGPSTDASLKAGARLYNEALKSRTKLEMKRQEREKEQEVDQEYRPNVNPESIAIIDLAEWKPIHERITDLQRDKDQRIHQQRLKEYQENPDLTYRPKILEKSENLRRGKGDVSSRLLAAGKEQESRLQQRKQHLEKENAKIYTYKPQVAKTSEHLLNNDPDLKDANFLERQKKLEEERTKKIKRFKQALRNVEKNVNTYKPNTGNANEILSYTRPERVIESSDETYHRLANEDAQRKKIWHKVMEDEYYKQFKFQPELNETSKAVGKAHTWEELSSGEDLKQKRAQLQQEAEDNFAAQYTFRPQFTTDPDHVLAKSKKERFRLKFSDDVDGVMDRINEWKNQREAKLAEERREREFHNLEGCTFVPQRPESDERVQQPQGPVVVRGLGRHLELQELAARKQDEYKRRYDAAFHEHARYRDVSEATRPEPFHFQLEDEEREKRRQQRMEQLKSDVENSYVPTNTNGKHNSEKQRRINALLATAETDFASPLPQRQFQARSPAAPHP